MSNLVRLLRHTAQLLLLLTPLTVLTGFLAAKWFLAEGWISPATVHAWHVRWLPLAFLPVVFVHSLCGILFLLRRNGRLDRPIVRAAAAALWTSLFAVFVWLYLASAPSSPAIPPAAEFDAPPAEEVGGKERTREATPAGTSAEAPDATDGPWENETLDAPGAVESDRATTEMPELPERPEGSGSPPPADAADDAPFPPTDASVRPARVNRSSRDVPAADARRAEAVLAQRCSSCHDLNPIRNARHDAAGWAAVIDRMIGYGAVAHPGERALLIRYLADR